MDKSYKPLTPPDRKAYEPYVKPKYVDDTSKKIYKGKFKPKKAKPSNRCLYQVCEKCGNIINTLGECDFCEHVNVKKIYIATTLQHFSVLK